MKIHEPPMTFKSPEAASNWERGLSKNQDPYGNACFRYASEWATRMEKAIASGDTVEACAEKLSHDADDEGITGLMYGAAVAMLSDCWIHGETLRRWHNLSMQIGNEGEKVNDDGGVLNPAVVKIGTKETTP